MHKYIYTYLQSANNLKDKYKIKQSKDTISHPLEWKIFKKSNNTVCKDVGKEWRIFIHCQ